MEAVSTTYPAIARKGDHYWLVEVAELGYTTQARRLSEIELMARDLVAVMLQVDAATVQIRVDLQLPDQFTVHADAAERLRAQAAQANTAAAAESRAAAQALRNAGLGLKEISEVMGRVLSAGESAPRLLTCRCRYSASASSSRVVPLTLPARSAAS